MVSNVRYILEERKLRNRVLVLSLYLASNSIVTTQMVLLKHFTVAHCFSHAL